MLIRHLHLAFHAEVLLRGFFEFLFAFERAKVVFLPVVLGCVFGGSLDVHPAHRIDWHDFLIVSGYLYDFCFTLSDIAGQFAGGKLRRFRFERDV
jgi:hypothetical protein